MYDGSDVKWDTNLSGEVYVINNPPDCFNNDNLGKIENYQIFWWDETHIKVIFGFLNLNQNTCFDQFYYVANSNFISKGDEINGNFN